LVQENQTCRIVLYLNRAILADSKLYGSYLKCFLPPFGGYKRSGFGRESGLSAIREYLQEKSVWIDTSGETPNPFVTR
jgi:aldehyde dehydrogenase (NAD+)